MRRGEGRAPDVTDSLPITSLMLGRQEKIPRVTLPGNCYEGASPPTSTSMAIMLSAKHTFYVNAAYVAAFLDFSDQDNLARRHSCA